MRKQVFGRKLKRTTNQRKGLFKSLIQALVIHGRIQTTEAKAKSIKGEVEKLITYAKNHEIALPYLLKHVDLKTGEGIISIAPVFKNRPGGYTRIIRIGSRKKDNASMVILEFVEKTKAAVVEPKKKEAKPVKATTTKEIAVKAEAKKPVKKAATKAKK